MKERWDAFVRTSKNGTFLLMRDYMEYHSDRFTDGSYVFENEEGELLALLPASVHGDELRSHGGLTYGGLIMSDRTSAAGENSPLAMLSLLVEELRRQGFKSLEYKPVPYIYHRQPSEEDLYALFRLGARLDVRNLASVIRLHPSIPSSRLGKRALKRQRQNGITVERTDCASDFWQIIVDDRRVRHNTVPVHTGEEMQLLRDRFPDNILFYKAMQGEETLAGAVIYRDRGVMHLQYAAATEAGKQLYAVDVIYHELIFNIFPDDSYFDFGSNNEDRGRYLNEGMVHHKEEFGARSVVYDSWQLPL